MMPRMLGSLVYIILLFSCKAQRQVSNHLEI